MKFEAQLNFLRLFWSYLTHLSLLKQENRTFTKRRKCRKTRIVDPTLPKRVCVWKKLDQLRPVISLLLSPKFLNRPLAKLYGLQQEILTFFAAGTMLGIFFSKATSRLTSF